MVAALFDDDPVSFLRRVPGRETLAWRDPAGTPWVVKRFGPESAWEAWRAGRGTSPARREGRALLQLASLGLAVPRPALLAERDRSSLLLMEWIPHAHTLREQRPDPELAEALLTLVLRLHGAGWVHRDLYLHHFVLDQRRPGPQGLTLLDCGRARPARRRRWFVKDLAALGLWSASAGLRVQLRFLLRYLKARGYGQRAARRDFVEQVVARGRRMAAHQPRHGEEGGWPTGGEYPIPSQASPR